MTMALRQVARMLQLSRVPVARVLQNKASCLLSQATCRCQHIPLQTTARVPAIGFHTSSIRRNEHIINIQDEDDFKTRVCDSTSPVIVDFHASWCGPCKLLGPRLESLVAEQKGDVTLAKIDIDDNQDLAIEYGVEAVPTVLGMKNGKVVDKFVGAKMDDELNTFISKLKGA